MRRKKEVTLTDIAREVGVSTMTVSAVLNGSKSTVRVSEQTSLRVREAAKKLQYGIATLDGSGGHRRTNSIGIIAEFSHPGDMNLFLLNLLDGVFEACLVSGQRSIVHPVTIWSKDEKHLVSYCDGTVDGFVFLAPRLSPEVARHFFRSAPMISVHNAGSISGATNIDVDNCLGAYLGTKHLIELGHTRIAHVTGAPFRSGTDDRLLGYRNALTDSGIEPDPNLLVRGFYSMASGIDAGKEFLERLSGNKRPTAVFCANDASACGFIGYLRQNGVRVPEDVSVVGFDDEPVAHLPVLNLTTVRQPLKSMAVHAVSLLLKAIDEGSGEPNRGRECVLEANRSMHYQDVERATTDFRTILFRPTMVIRQTSAPLR